MTGRDLIVYILENGLEDEPFIEDGKILGFMTREEVAIACGVGLASVDTWIRLSAIQNVVEIGDAMYIPITENNFIPRKTHQREGGK